MLNRFISCLILVSFLCTQTVALAQSSGTPGSGVFETVETQFTQARTTDDLVNPFKDLVTVDDIAWFKTQPGYTDYRKKTQISRRGNTLLISYETAPRTTTPVASVTVVDESTLTFSINGQTWQYHPFLTSQENVKQLQDLLQKHPSRHQPNLTLLYDWLVPDTHAVVPLLAGAASIASAAAVLYLALSVAVIALCSVSILHSDYNKNLIAGCFALPLIPLKWAYEWARRATGSRQMPKITSISCEKSKRPEVAYEQYMKIQLDTGSIEAYTAAGRNQVQMNLNAGKGFPDVTRVLDADKDWQTFNSGNAGADKGLDKVAKQALRQIPTLLDLCKNPKQLEKVLQKMKASGFDGVPITAPAAATGTQSTGAK